MILTQSAFSREFRENWRTLASSFCCFLFAFSAPAFSLPFLYGPIIEEFGWTREQATLLASAKYLAGAVAAVVAGRLVDAIGVRVGLVILSALGGLAMLSFLWVPDLRAYYAVGVLLGVSGTGIIVAAKVLVARNFHVSQGTAMSVAMLGTALGATITPLVITPLIAEYGWRTAAALLSLGTWCVALPVLLLLTNDQRLGTGAAERETRPFSLRLLRELGARREFWLIALAVFCAAVVDQAFIQHQVLYLEFDLGLSPAYVAAGVSAMGLIGIGARVAVGWVFDKLSARGVSLMYLTLAGAAAVALFAANPVIFSVFVVLRAVGHAAVLLDSAVLSKHVFGLQNMGLLLGIYTAFVAFGFSVGPWLVGRVYSMTGSYAVPFTLCIGLALFAAAVLLPVRPAHWLARRSAQSDSASEESSAKAASTS